MSIPTKLISNLTIIFKDFARVKHAVWVKKLFQIAHDIERGAMFAAHIGPFAETNPMLASRRAAQLQRALDQSGIKSHHLRLSRGIGIRQNNVHIAITGMTQQKATQCPRL